MVKHACTPTSTCSNLTVPAAGTMEAPQIGRQLVFLTAWFCPFAQRTTIVLNEAQLSYQVHEVAIKNPKTGLWHQLGEKPKWFLELSPLGKVPALAFQEHDGRTRSVWESLICNEFLVDYAPEAKRLLPSDPADRATARIIIDRFDRRVVPRFYSMLIRQDREEQQRCADEINDELQWLEQQVQEPFIMGQDFSLVDAALLPWFLRMPIQQHYRGYRLPANCQRLSRWAEQASQRPSVQATQRHSENLNYEEQLLRHYGQYADGTANSTSARDFK